MQLCVWDSIVVGIVCLEFLARAMIAPVFAKPYCFLAALVYFID